MTDHIRPVAGVQLDMLSVSRQELSPSIFHQRRARATLLYRYLGGQRTLNEIQVNGLSCSREVSNINLGLLRFCSTHPSSVRRGTTPPSARAQPTLPLLEPPVDAIMCRIAAKSHGVTAGIGLEEQFTLQGRRWLRVCTGRLCVMWPKGGVHCAGSVRWLCTQQRELGAVQGVLVSERLG